MILKLQQMNPTHLTQLSPTIQSVAPWARIYGGKTVVMSENNYSALHVTCVVITVFRTHHHQTVYCSHPYSPHNTALFIEDLFSFFSSYLCPGFQVVFSDKLFPSKFCVHFFRLPRPIGDKNCQFRFLILTFRLSHQTAHGYKIKITSLWS